MEWLGKLIALAIETLERICPIKPFRTLHLALMDREWPCWWTVSQIEGKNVMKLEANLLVTNITKHDVVLVDTLINKETKRKGEMMVVDLGSKSIFVSPNTTIKVAARFTIQPPDQNDEGIYVQDVAIVDQFSNKHWLKCSFEYTPDF